jgi:hypothetical protein
MELPLITFGHIPYGFLPDTHGEFRRDDMEVAMESPSRVVNFADINGSLYQ